MRVQRRLEESERRGFRWWSRLRDKTAAAFQSGRVALVRFGGNTCRSKVDPQHSLRLVCLLELLYDASLISGSSFILVVLQEELWGMLLGAVGGQPKMRLLHLQQNTRNQVAQRKMLVLSSTMANGIYWAAR